MKKLFLGLVVISTVVLTGCAGLLGAEPPRGGQASDEQMKNTYKAFEAQLNGVYYYMAAGTYTGQQKYIDLATDALTSDAVIVANIYGWSQYYLGRIYNAYGSSSILNNEVWGSEYAIIRNINLLMLEAKKRLETGETGGISVERLNNVLGQAYALRAHAYCNLLNLYTNPDKVKDDYQVIPYYNDDSTVMESTQPYSSYKVVAQYVENDFLRAIELLKDSERSANDKNTIDVDVARVLLANFYMNDGRVFQIEKESENLQKALALYDEVINKNKYSILPYNQVLTNGFNSTASTNWMWGVDVDIQSSLRINSFWSWMDIFSYGYASATDNISLDDSIYNNFDNMLSPTDIRKKWWIAPNDPTKLPNGKDTYGDSHKLAPYNKFFSPARQHGEDKVWLNDLVYMRIEEVHILAAEAAAASGNDAKAIEYLKPLIEQRDPEFAANGLETLSGDALKAYINNNLRIELWMEGKSYMAWKRNKWQHTRGQDHSQSRGEPVEYNDPSWYYLELNATERQYNPNPYNQGK